MLKVDFKQVRKGILPQPQEKLGQLRKIIPAVLQERVSYVREWLEKHIKTIKVPPESVDAYVKQVQAIEYIDDNF